MESELGFYSPTQSIIIIHNGTQIISTPLFDSHLSFRESGEYLALRESDGNLSFAQYMRQLNNPEEIARLVKFFVLAGAIFSSYDVSFFLLLFLFLLSRLSKLLTWRILYVYFTEISVTRFQLRLF